MKKKFNFIRRSFYLFSTMIVAIISLNNSLMAQATGEVVNLGLYGGAAVDLTYCNTNLRLFGAVNTPASLFYTDDDGANWTQPFPVDSLEYENAQRGWGGGGIKLLTNSKGWVALRTAQQGGTLSASVISFTDGDSGSFHTAIDKYMLHQINPAYNPQSVTGMGLSDHYQYTGLEQYLIRINDTSTYGNHNVVTRTDTITGIGVNYRILDIAIANHETGYPVYMITGTSGNDGGTIYSFDGTSFVQLTVAGFPNRVERIFTHPSQITGDTLIASIKNTTTNIRFVYLTVDGGITWSNITPAYGTNWPLHSADYSASWVGSMPLSNGLRLSFPGGGVSDDLGATWTVHVLPDNAMASFPTDPTKVFGAYGLGVAMSITGPEGSFSITDNVGMAAVSITKIAQSKGIYYVSTNAGLGYTNAYFDETVTGIDRWKAPYGTFPIGGVGDDAGVSTVAVSPTDSLHVVAGHTNGFSVSSTGPVGFSNVTPIGWNTSTNYDSRVNAIRFVSDEIVVAVTGSGSNVLQYPTSPYGNIWRSGDGGLSWSLVTPVGFLQGNAVEVGTANGDTVLYAGTGYYDQSYPKVDGALWRSDDLGLSWSFVNNGPTGLMSGTVNMPIYDVDVNPRGNDTIYLASGENLDYALVSSVDGGVNYTYTAVVPHGAFSSVLVNSRNPDVISAGARRNVFRLNTVTGVIDTTFFGLPGEFVPDLENGSTLLGTTTGFFRITENYGADTTRWNGTGNWSEAARWSNGMPEYLKNVVIESGASQIDDGFEVNELIVNPLCDLTLLTSGELSMNSNLILKSDATGTASFINQKPGTGSYNATVENYLTDGRWHYVSPLVDAATASSYYFAGGSQTWLKEYDEITNTWIYITDETQALETGKGYALWLNTARENETAIYTGRLNKGNQLINLSYSGADHGWNMIGNPFPSAVNWDLGSWNPQNTTGIAYIWNNGNYLTRNQIGQGTLTNGIIPAGQAFFVQATDAVASVTLPEDACTHNHQQFYKESRSAYVDVLDITVSSGDKTDKTWISFHENGTEGMDVGLDALRLNGTDDMPQLFTKNVDIKLSINVLTTLTTTREIPLYFVAAESGDFEISFDYIESFENDTVILIDLLTGAEVDLKINPTYSFSADPTDSEYRFKLVFNPDAVSIKESPSQDENRPIVSSVHEKIIIDWNTENDIHATVRVLDLSGRKLGEYSTNETSTFSIAAGAWNQQIVLIQIMNKHSVYNYKLFIQ
jgi:hypothetical protein